MKRGIRNNNPLNIRHSNSCWKGMITEQTDKEFVQFKNMAFGYRAAWRILFTYFYRFVTKKQPFTVETILHRWAPPCENDTQAYIHTVMKMTSIGGKERLGLPANVLNYPKLARLLAAMTVVENGIALEEVDTQAIEEGYRLAFPDQQKELDNYLLAPDEYNQW